MAFESWNELKTYWLELHHVQDSF